MKTIPFFSTRPHLVAKNDGGTRKNPCSTVISQERSSNENLCIFVSFVRSSFKTWTSDKSYLVIKVKEVEFAKEVKLLVMACNVLPVAMFLNQAILAMFCLFDGNLRQLFANVHDKRSNEKTLKGFGPFDLDFLIFGQGSEIS